MGADLSVILEMKEEFSEFPATALSTDGRTDRPRFAPLMRSFHQTGIVVTLQGFILELSCYSLGGMVSSYPHTEAFRGFTQLHSKNVVIVCENIQILTPFKFASTYIS
jgi:hypothetical protein